MARINLLPWREARRKRQQRNFLLMMGAGLLGTALLMTGVHMTISQRLEVQQARNQFLTKELDILTFKVREIQDLEKKKKNLISRMDVIQQLQVSRPAVVHLFEELRKTVPEGLQLLDMEQRDRTIAINGIAQSNARISVYMRNLEVSPWLQQPSLLVIEAKPESKNKKESQMSRFSLHVIQSSDSSPEGAAEALPAGAAVPKGAP